MNNRSYNKDTIHAIEDKQGMIFSENPTHHHQTSDKSIRMKNVKIWVDEGKSVEKIPERSGNVSNDGSIFFVLT